MKSKISRNKIIIIESAIIFLLLLLILFMGIKFKKNTSRLFKMSVSQFEKNNIVTITPNSDEANNSLYFWLNSDNQIGNVSYVNGDYAITSLIDDNKTFCSTIDYPDFKETSYLLPESSGEIKDRNIKDIFIFKKFIFQSGKTVDFVIDKNGNATLLNDK